MKRALRLVLWFFIGGLLGLIAAVGLSGCAKDEPPPPQIVTVTREVPTPQPAECTAAPLPEPRLAGGRSRQVGDGYRAMRRAFQRSEALRRVCRRGSTLAPT